MRVCRDAPVWPQAGCVRACRDGVMCEVVGEGAAVHSQLAASSSASSPSDPSHQTSSLRSCLTAQHHHRSTRTRTPRTTTPPRCAVYTSVVGKESAVTVAVLSVWPIIIEATKTLDKKQDTPSIFPWAEPWKQQ